MMYWPKYNHTEFMTAEYKCYSAGKAGDTSTGSEVRRVGKKYNGSLKSDGTRRDCGKRVHEGFVRIVALDSIHSLFCTVADLKKMVSVIERNGGIIEKLNHEKIELHEKLHKTQKLIETTYMDFTSEILSYEEYIQLKEHYISEERQLSEEIQRVDYEIQRIRNKVRDFLKWAESIDSEWFDNSETEQKLIDELISEIYITDNLEVEIVFHCDDIIAEINSLQEENV